MAKQRPPGAGASLGERAWWAYQCIGAPPYAHLEQNNQFAVGQLRRLLIGERRKADDVTLRKLEAALQVPVQWLLTGKGDAPEPPNGSPIPPWPGLDVTPRKRRMR